jgi:hypothetical protein
MNETTKMLVGVEILLLGAAWYFDGVLTLVFGFLWLVIAIVIWIRVEDEKRNKPRGLP